MTIVQIAFIFAILAPLVLALVAGRKRGRGWALTRVLVYGFLGVFFLYAGISSFIDHRTDPDQGTSWWLMLMIALAAGSASARSRRALRDGDYRSLPELAVQDAESGNR